MAMTSATVGKKFASLTDTQQKAVGYFIFFPLSQNGGFGDAESGFEDGITLVTREEVIPLYFEQVIW